MIFPPIPKDTVKAALALFGRSNFYLATGDQANHLFEGFHLQVSSGLEGKPASNLASLYLITIFQYLESLPDYLVPGALRDRLDWKYALHLSPGYAHLEAQDLCKFRQNTLLDRMGMQFFQVLLARLAAFAQPPGLQLQNLQAQQVISRVCMFSRIGKVWEAINQALEALAVRQPEWLLDNSRPHWFERYDPNRKNIDLSTADQELQAAAQAIGLDGRYLLKAIAQSDLPALQEIAEVKALKKVWQEQYFQHEEQILWRQATCAGCKLANQRGSTIPQ